MAKWVKRLFLVTTNLQHPAFVLKNKYQNIEPIFFKDKVDLSQLLHMLKANHGVDRLTIQSGGTLNSSWVRESLIDYVSIVIAPCLIGGTNTQSLIGGESLHNEDDLKKIKSLTLIKNTTLKNSYIHLLYKICNTTEIDLLK